MAGGGTGANVIDFVSSEKTNGLTLRSGNPPSNGGRHSVDEYDCSHLYSRCGSDGPVGEHMCLFGVSEEEWNIVFAPNIYINAFGLG